MSDMVAREALRFTRTLGRAEESRCLTIGRSSTGSPEKLYKELGTARAEGAGISLMYGISECSCCRFVIVGVGLSFNLEAVFYQHTDSTYVLLGDFFLLFP